MASQGSRHWARLLARGLLSLPAPVLRGLSGADRTWLDAQLLEPELQLLLAIAARANIPAVEDVPIEEARAKANASWTNLAVGGPPLFRVETLRVAGPDTHEVQVRIYEPHGLVQKRPALIYLHGGGFVLGNLDTHDPVARFYAQEARCVVISVDYRLAPEHRFPAAVDDCLSAAAWVFGEGAMRLGLDRARIAIAGDSAGGNLAAVVCQQRARAGLPLPCYQLLTYPLLDPGADTRSRELFSDGYLLTRSAIEYFCTSYLKPKDFSDVRAAPLLCSDLGGLPPAHVVTAGFDPLRDEGREYATRLAAAGVPTKYSCEHGLTHGFVSLAGAVRPAKCALEKMARGLRERFTTSVA